MSLSKGLELGLSFRFQVVCNNSMGSGIIMYINLESRISVYIYPQTNQLLSVIEHLTKALNHRLPYVQATHTAAPRLCPQSTK